MQFALLVSVIVAILLSTFLLLTHIQSFFRIKSQELVEASALVNQEILSFLEDGGIYGDTLVTTHTSRTHTIVSNYHGAFINVLSRVQVQQRKVAKSALIGVLREENTPNLYLANTNSPLVVVGDTRIEGNNYLPKQGVKAGTISGNYYQGSSLYYGRILESKQTIPDLNAEWISYLETLVNGGLIKEEKLVRLSKEVHQSFLKPSKLIYDTESIILGDHQVVGNVIIQSGTKIVITSAAQLTDVILVAPIIEVSANVQGTFQLIATKKITIGKRCHLHYPSAIIVYDQDRFIAGNTDNRPQNRNIDFSIDTNTIIEGSVVFIKKEQQKQERIKTHLNVENGVEIIGEVYCQGNIDFQGGVRGSLYTQQFIANQSGSIYLNHLYNGKVLKNPISGYAGLPFDTPKKAIAKWMY